MHQSTSQDIHALQNAIAQKEMLFDLAMQNDQEFEEMKKLYVEIKTLKQQLQSLLQKINADRANSFIKGHDLDTVYINPEHNNKAQ